MMYSGFCCLKGKIKFMNKRCIIIPAYNEELHIALVIEGIKKVLSELQSIFVFDPIPSHMRDYKKAVAVFFSSTPFFPSFAGAPTKTSLIPYCPFRKTEQGIILF